MPYPTSNLDYSNGVVGASADAEALAANAAFTDRYELKDPYARFRLKLRTDAANTKMVQVGDSTSLIANYPGTYNAIKYAMRDGGPLEGMLEANLFAGGNNGQTLQGWNSDPDVGSGYSLNQMVADDPDLVVMSFGLNDTRLGATAAQMIDRIETFIANVQAALPNADICLRMPNSVAGTGAPYLTGATAQEATDACYYSYMYFVNRYANVGVIDTQRTIFGRIASTTTHPFLGDQLHPSSDGQYAVGRLIAQTVGLTVNDQGWAGSPQIPLWDRNWHVEGIQLSSAGNGYIDFGASIGLEGNAYGTAVSVQAGDILWVEDYGFVDLTGATLANTAGFNQRILKSGDWTAIANKRAALLTNRKPGITQGKRWFLSVDPPSVPAGGTASFTLSVSDVDVYTGVVVQPPTQFTTLDLIWCAFVSATDTVTIRMFNPTGAPIDPPSANNWLVWPAY